MLRHTSEKNLSCLYGLVTQGIPKVFMKPISHVLLLIILLSFQACAPASMEKGRVWDPIEPVNRGVFWFNDQVDTFVLEPVARGYDWLFPSFFKRGVDNFLTNLSYPQLLLSDLFQLKLDQAGTHTGRFILNTTAGLAGLFDVAEMQGMKHHEEDFGTALGYWGVGPGPYIVLPLLGPSNLRDTVGFAVDRSIHPTAILEYTNVRNRIQNAISIPVTGLNIINARYQTLDTLENIRESSIDYYEGVKSSYSQFREGLIFDGSPPGQEDEWLEDNDFEQYEAEDE